VAEKVVPHVTQPQELASDRTLPGLIKGNKPQIFVHKTIYEEQSSKSWAQEKLTARGVKEGKQTLKIVVVRRIGVLPLVDMKDTPVFR
jgi:hypothetical protein